MAKNSLNPISFFGQKERHSPSFGGNIWQSQNCTKNYYASSYAPKASWHKKNIQKEYFFLRFKQSSSNHLYKDIEGGSTYRECNRKYVVKAAPGPSFESESPAFDSKNILESVKNFINVFFKLISPYAMIAAALSITSASLLAVEKLSDISPQFFIGLLQGLIPNLFMGVYMAGLNQLCDIEIDKINKPHLPLASGEISFTTGVIIIASSFIVSLWLGSIVGSWPSLWALISFCVIWTGYSVNVPLLRWKRHPALAAMCIIATWGFIFPIGYFLHIQTFVFKRSAVFSRPVVFSTIFMSFFSLVIALFKDIPDIEGDQAFGVQSFSASLGQKRVFWICVSLLETAYGVALLMGATSSCLWSKIITVLGHAILALVLFYRAKSINLKSKASIASFFMFIWKLLYAEYFLVPLVR
uniref:Flavone prenyltransferase n=1 Tax=Glycyrrhiza uralensis TaxID=74613 RepID=A0A097EU60_GLYUR|nr:flavone prenyltransferase [Glycyrrhiza uralensis]